MNKKLEEIKNVIYNKFVKYIKRGILLPEGIMYRALMNADEYVEAIVEDAMAYVYGEKFVDELLCRIENVRDEKVERICNECCDLFVNDGRYSTTRYYIEEQYGKYENVFIVVKEILSNVNIDLLEKIYPIFLLYIMNCNYNSEGNTIDQFIHFLVSNDNEKEKFLFALLIPERTDKIAHCNIFTGIRRSQEYVFKKSIQELVQNIEDAHYEEVSLSLYNDIVFFEDYSDVIDNSLEAFQDAKAKIISYRTKEEENLCSQAINGIKSLDLNTASGRSEYVENILIYLENRKEKLKKSHNVIEDNFVWFNKLYDKSVSGIVNDYLLLYLWNKITGWIDFYSFIQGGQLDGYSNVDWRYDGQNEGIVREKKSNAFCPQAYIEGNSIARMQIINEMLEFWYVMDYREACISLIQIGNKLYNMAIAMLKHNDDDFITRDYDFPDMKYYKMMHEEVRGKWGTSEERADIIDVAFFYSEILNYSRQ